jgi:hypothetical protein
MLELKEIILMQARDELRKVENRQ